MINICEKGEKIKDVEPPKYISYYYKGKTSKYFDCRLTTIWFFDCLTNLSLEEKN